MIVHGDCLDVMAGLEPESVAAVVTDPPYGLGFMGKRWDHGVPGVPFWTEMLRVAKPGAHLLAFGGTRTVHRIASAIEDAGWEIRDCLVWAYASGFPKSHNLDGEWDGWGTALKPAWEPIVMARKPLRGTVAANVAAHGTGAINIDGTRISLDATDTELRDALALRPDLGRRLDKVMDRRPTVGMAGRSGGILGRPIERVRETTQADPSGRWPANVILTDPIFDGGIEGVVIEGEARSSGDYQRSIVGDMAGAATIPIDGLTSARYGDSGTYSRFFLIPKADRGEREPVAGSLGIGRVSAKPDGRQWDIPGSHSRDRQNVHPTVKPVDLMRHLVRLVTPAGGTVLDPFLGSGTTGIACEMEGFDWIGIEKEAEYVAIAEARLDGVQRGFGLSA